MKTLTYVSTKDVSELTYPVTVNKINLYTPALNVFTDFNEIPPRVIESNTPADELVRLMRKEHVRMKLVVDANNTFIGIISVEDLCEEAFIKHVANGFSRSELVVADLMRPKESLLALSYSALKNTDIETLLYSQRSNALQHLLVIDETNKTIRGVVSSSDIARKLKLDIDVAFSNFINIYKIALLGDAQLFTKSQVA